MVGRWIPFSGGQEMKAELAQRRPGSDDEGDNNSRQQTQRQKRCATRQIEKQYVAKTRALTPRLFGRRLKTMSIGRQGLQQKQLHPFRSL